MSGTNSAYLDFGKTTGGVTTQNLSGASNGICFILPTKLGNHSSISFVDHKGTTTNAFAYFEIQTKVSGIQTLYFNDNSANGGTHILHLWKLHSKE